MRETLQNTSLRTKLLIIVCSPLLAFLAMGILKITLLQKEVTENRNLLKLLDFSVAANTLVHEFQKERGNTAGFINSRGREFSDSLTKQRANTDQKIKEFEAVLVQTDVDQFGEEYSSKVKSALNDIKKLEDMRSKISSLSLPLSEAVTYYTEMNAHILEITKKSIIRCAKTGSAS